VKDLRARSRRRAPQRGRLTTRAPLDRRRTGAMMCPSNSTRRADTPDHHSDHRRSWRRRSCGPGTRRVWEWRRPRRSRPGLGWQCRECFLPWKREGIRLLRSLSKAEARRDVVREPKEYAADIRSGRSRSRDARSAAVIPVATATRRSSCDDDPARYGRENDATVRKSPRR